jgi:2-dehydro-3-deoxyphosphogluconate aldolase/(4S)-4-hydroxy-2-oxoglutarate aldolase
MMMSEVVRAWDLGAMMVKIFPAESVGPNYIRALKAPLPHIKLLPTGGVDLETLPAFLKAGADGFGIGSPLFNRQRVESGDWTWVEAQCRAFAEAHRRAS